MDHHGSGFVASPWAAVLGHHSMASDAGFAAAAAAAHVQNHSMHHPIHSHHHHHSHTHPHPHPHSHPHHHPHLGAAGGMPMDLHVPQGFPYYRYREDALCWGDRKSMEEIGAAQSSVNARILELRKEKSRDAARSRRGKENYEFYELAKMLPLPAAITSQLDKASIIRLTISYLKLRDFSGHGDPPWTREASSSSKLKSAAIRRSPAVDLFEQHQGTHILQSLDGFALAVAADGRFLYISETVSIYLGLSQVEMTGSSIFDYIHQADHSEIAEQLGLSLTSGAGGGGGGGGGSSSSGGGGGGAGVGMASPTSGASDDGNGTHVAASMTQASTSGYKGYDRSFCIRMKSTLTKRGCHFKSSGYRASDATSNCNNGNNASNNAKNVKNPGSNYSVVLLLCKLRPQYTFSHSRKSQPPLLGMVALAIALPPPSVHEIRLECDMFVTRVNFDLRVAHCEPRVSDLLDYTPEDLVNKSLYSLCHAEDANRLRKSHSDLIEKGQVLTGYYRLMNKSGGYTWLQTCATVVCSTKNADEQNIICVNYVISNRENENMILDCCQLEPSPDSIKHEEGLGNDKSSGSPGGDASGEGNSHLSAGDMKLNSEPKTDSEGHSHRGRGRSAAASHGSSLNSLTMIKDSPTPLGVDIDAGVLPTTVATPVPASATPNGSSSASTKRKRKTKASQQQADEQNQDQVIPDQPLPKLPAMEQRDHQPRSRLPSIVDEQQQQQQQQPDSAVKDLEQAMSKHLPSPVAVVSVAPPPNNTDFSADSLLKQQQQQQQQHLEDPNEKSSTIQWIGTPYQQPPAPMPATALLRQLYANRESVIRATARQTPTGVFYGDQQTGPLPTPPGSESSYENQYLQLHSAASGGHPGAGGQKSSADAFTNLVSTYGGYHSSIDYHNAMTPPSSVSPRDSNQPGKAAPVLTSSNGGYDYAPDPLRGQYVTATGDGVATTLPLKPQASYTTTMHPSAGGSTTTEGGVTYSNLDQPQYFAPHSSFHLYHKGSPASGWYSTPS
ncbi:protein trachealess isoform X2 [Drosophila elegans]|uniref:protein trachealess isoform X2 n=1 Tax=Drosophila elegans TaxID=30023 RepID=UPI001BC84FA0|nr:protein trachealess isoform X2 [Drosophila elegans]